MNDLIYFSQPPCSIITESHFSEVETDAQRSRGVPPRTPSKWGTEEGSERRGLPTTEPPTPHLDEAQTGKATFSSSQSTSGTEQGLESAFPTPLSGVGLSHIPLQSLHNHTVPQTMGPNSRYLWMMLKGPSSSLPERSETLPRLSFALSSHLSRRTGPGVLSLFER